MSFLESNCLGLRMVREVTVALLLIAALCVDQQAEAQDQFVVYFPGTTAAVGNLGGFTFNENGDFWVVGQTAPVGLFPTPRINKVEFDGSNWVTEGYVTDQDMVFFYRSSSIVDGATNPLWGGPMYGTPASFLLNPAPLTIEIPLGTGGTQLKTYQPGELAFISDAMRELSEADGTERADRTKKIYRYDLRKVDNPDGSISGPTTSEPDFDNAKNGDGTDPNDFDFGEFGLADWNDVFTQVISEEDLRNAAGEVGGSDNFGRSFAWSTDGQSIYAIDAGSSYGGIYKVDATTTGSVQQLWADTSSDSTVQFGANRINTEPAIVHTSVRDFDSSNAGVGDQIIVEGSLDGGNHGGLNSYLDTVSGSVTPLVIFDEATFRNFAEYVGVSSPQYLSVTADAAGNLYFYEIGTDGLYMYDTQGRLAKIASEAEHNLLQQNNGLGANDNFLDLQTRVSTAPGFAVTEIVFQDDAFDAPIGLLAYKIGDFDRDNDVDQDDLNLFGAALATRGTVAAPEDFKFDLNGNPETVFDPEDMRYEHVSGGAAVVDWKDVKVLQQFVNIPDGDANLDGLLDLTDLDIVSANYYTNPSQTMETWVDGDFTSIEPDYPLDAVDLNLVNEADLGLFAQSWVNVLMQTPLTEGDLTGRGYSTDFIDDVLFAFDKVGGIAGDYNGDGVINIADYTVWRDSLAATGSNLPADGNGDLVVDQMDYNVWKNAFGAGNNPSEIAGDYNGDGVVNLADYTVWRDSLAATGSDLPADGNGDLVVNQLDYNVWKNALGANASVAGSTTPEGVPEPSSSTVFVLASLLSLRAAARHRHPRSRIG